MFSEAGLKKGALNSMVPGAFPHLFSIIEKAAKNGTHCFLLFTRATLPRFYRTQREVSWINRMQKMNWKWNWMWEANFEYKSALRLVQAIPLIVALTTRKLSLLSTSFLEWLSGWAKLKMSCKEFIIKVEKRKSWFWRQCAFWETTATGDLDCQEPEPLWWQVLRQWGQKHLKPPWEGSGNGRESQELTHLFWWKVVFWFLHFYKLESACLFLVFFLLCLFFHLFNTY